MGRHLQGTQFLLNRTLHRPRGYATRTSRPDPASTLARWLATAQSADSPDQLWQLLQSRNYADLWYGARYAGETIRAQALARLYTQRPQPGGAHPDPREPAAFSSSAIIAAAARNLGLAWYTIPDILAEHADRMVAAAQRPLLAWLITYPDRRPPDLAVRTTSTVARMHFAAACVMGYYVREAPRLNDSAAPAGMILPPTDPLTTPILHQFAKALLCLENDCPRDKLCMCNQIRARYNEPPADHAQPTDALDAAELRDAVQHHLRRRRPADSQPDPSKRG